ncbi:MAG: hypothetical protein CMF55_00730 [Legionellales bacterium]|nr:hypothetical protein [Legionellales bacterium]|tara:strand:- start:4217 stop:4912 length:696 start_codon:yes stop_codon:yes gene_type:complete
MLLVDDRENPKVVNKLLMRMGSDKVNVCRMKSSDYTMGEWGIEAKEINDLYRSIMGFGRTRTIVDQLRDLQDSCEHPFLVVYGTQLKPYVHNGRPSARSLAVEMARMKKVIQQFKATFYQRFPKIKYMEVTTMDEFVEWLVVNHTQQGLALHRLATEEKNAVKKSKLDSRIQILSSIEGITTTQAEDLLNEFESIPNILRKGTTQKSLMQVSGITRRKARAILALREDYEL